MPLELWLLVVVLLLLVGLPLVIVWIDMVSIGLGTTAQVLAVSWLIGLILMLAIPLKAYQPSEPHNGHHDHLAPNNISAINDVTQQRYFRRSIVRSCFLQSSLRKSSVLKLIITPKKTSNVKWTP